MAGGSSAFVDEDDALITEINVTPLVDVVLVLLIVLMITMPAIAEALFATAIGLVAAIPAYIAYNKFSTDAARFASRLESFADDLTTAIARRLGK